MKDDAHDKEYEGVIIPFPDPRQQHKNAGPLCEKCRDRHFARNEGRGKCGHSVFFSGYSFCGRCAIIKMICRACGCDVSGLFRQLERQREQAGRRPKPKEKPGMKVFKK